MNSGPPTSTSKKKGCLARALIIFGVFAGIGLAVFLTVFSVWRFQLRSSVHGQIAAIQREGLPLNWDDLAKWPVEIPDSENAALIYTNAIARLVVKVIPTEDDTLPRLDQPLAEEIRTQLDAIVQTNLPAIEIADGVTNAGQSRYPINYEDGPTAQLPHLAGLKQLARVLQCEAIIDAAGSDPAGASRAVESSLKLSQSLDNEPLLISQFTSSAILTLSSRSLEDVLCRTTLSQDQLARLEKQFGQCETNNRFLTGLIGERAITGELIRLAQDDVRKLVEISNRTASQDDQTELPWRNPGMGWKFIGFWERDRNFYLQAMATNLFFIEQGPPASLKVTNVSAEIETRARKGFYIFSAMLLPSLSGIANRDAATRARLRTAIASLAVERWKLMHDGALPGTLAELAPQFLPSSPVDPFDGKTLRYKKLERGYCIYSVGPNQLDDGGKEISPRSTKLTREQRNSYDIVFTVQR